MSKKKLAILSFTHVAALAAGFALGIYMLPLLIAPKPPSLDELGASSSAARYTGTFHRGLKDSDLLHWGEGTVSVGQTSISLVGRLAPGPDYKLYLSPEFVETEADFNRLKALMVRVGDVRTFENFVVPVPPGIDVSRYGTVIIWCESFGQFISSAKYQ